MLAAGLLTGSCTEVVGGTAQAPPAPPSPDPIAAGEPCGLLTPEQAKELGYEGEGEFKAGEPESLIPPTCRWTSADYEQEGLTIGFAIDLPLVDYMDGVPAEEEQEIGGRTWGRYADPLGAGTCFIATELSETSFVVILSSNTSDESKMCDIALAAAEHVAGNLTPGG